MQEKTKAIRLKAASIHVCVSSILLGVLLVVMTLLGCGWPIWYLQGIEAIFGVVAFVDLCLGPIVTLIITNPRKERRELLRDWSIIGVIQIAALSYGALTLWEARPVAAVLAVDRIEIVTANMYSPERLVAARNKCEQHPPRYFPSWPTCWAVAKMPDDKKAQEKMLFSAIGGGADLSALPEFYVDKAHQAAIIDAAIVPVARAPLAYTSMAIEIRERLSEARVAEKDAGVLWIVGRARTALALIRKSDNMSIGYVVERPSVFQ